MTDQRVFYVLLLRVGGALNDGFEYWAERLPDVGDEIELAPPADFRLHSGDRTIVRAVVTGVEPEKAQPYSRTRAVATDGTASARRACAFGNPAERHRRRVPTGGAELAAGAAGR